MGCRRPRKYRQSCGQRWRVSTDGLSWFSFKPANEVGFKEDWDSARFPLCQRLVKSALPVGRQDNIMSTSRVIVTSEITIGNNTYDIVKLEGELYSQIEKARELASQQGEGGGRYLLENQQEIPSSFCGKTVFVFPGLEGAFNKTWRAVCWDGSSSRWVKTWVWEGWNDDYSILLLK